VRILEAEVNLENWHERKYGKGHKDIPATVRKLHEEVGELIECIMNEDSYGAAIESADVFFLLCTLNRHMNGNITLEQAIVNKLRIINDRLDKGK
jgi:NTP pyrophosphatase (non-canonical NTP hydrolase)